MILTGGEKNYVLTILTLTLHKPENIKNLKNP